MVKFIALSGTTGVNENLYIYEYQDKMLIVDCGIGFPDSEMLGVDMVIPDFSYIIKNKHKLVGILISHGHEDHMGALPYLMRDIKAPIYATKLVSAFIENKLKDNGIKNFDLKILNPDSDTPTQIGPFSINPFRVAHSVPDTICFLLETPEGKFVHATEYKFEQNPVDGFKVDEDKIRRLTQDGVLCVASDCLGSNKPGFTPSEAKIEDEIEHIVKSAPKTVYFSTVSSNISRMQMAINVAIKHGRFVSFAGRTIENKARIARDLGYLKFDDKLVLDLRQAVKKPMNKIMYIIAGSYGQPGSALFRLALGEHRRLHLDQGDTVIFSGDPAPPGAKETVDYVVDKLIDQDIDVHYYDLNEFLHVSGHGASEDIKKMLSLVNAKYLIPVGGTVRHMKAFQDLVAENKIAPKDNVFRLKTGEIVEFEKGNAKRHGKIEVSEILVDGLGVGDVGKVVLNDRRILSEGGIVLVVLQLNKDHILQGNPEIISRGFVYERENRKLINQTARKLKDTLTKRGKLNRKAVKEVTRSQLESYFASATGRKPMILPVVIEV